jgi:hypothetical protein
MITEPNIDQLTAWLTQHGFMETESDQHAAASD